LKPQPIIKKPSGSAKKTKNAIPNSSLPGAFGAGLGIPSAQLEISLDDGELTLNYQHSYVGEVGIWTGIWGLSTAALTGPLLPAGTVIAAAASPLFTWFLVRNVSGVPPLEVS
jgi:hypothetical protein